MSEQSPTTTLLPSPERRDRAIVLVHGAWVGEWSWNPILDLLAGSGRPVHAVSLTGHGTRRHQSGPQVTLADHVDDVVRHVEVHDLTAITLVGHSYGGRVITQASAALAERISALVYLDAHTPVAEDPGQNPERRAIAEANGGMLPFPGEYGPDPDLMGDDGVAFFTERVMPQSFACLAAPWVAPLPEGPSRTFVFASGYQPTRFGHYAEICRDDPAWAYHELDGPHFIMMSHPHEVAQIVLDA